jgi:hypothetical protein
MPVPLAVGARRPGFTKCGVLGTGKRGHWQVLRACSVRSLGPEAPCQGAQTSHSARDLRLPAARSQLPAYAGGLLTQSRNLICSPGSAPPGSGPARATQQWALTGVTVGAATPRELAAQFGYRGSLSEAEPYSDVSCAACPGPTSAAR